MRAVWIGLVLALACAAAATATESLDVYFLPVGHGDAILLQQGSTEWLIDAGYQEALQGKVGADCSSLFEVPIFGRIEYFVLTHDDRDHYSALNGPLDRCRIQTAAASVWGASVARLQSASATASAALTPLSATATPVGELGGSGLEWQLLAPSNADAALADCDNDQSLVLLVSFRDVHFLFAGDLQTAPSSAATWVIPQEGVLVLKAPHHGCKESALGDLVSRFSPDLVIFSTDLCSPNDVDTLVAKGIPFLTTARSGLIHLRTDGASVWVTSDTLSGERAPERCCESCGGRGKDHED